MFALLQMRLQVSQSLKRFVTVTTGKIFRMRHHVFIQNLIISERFITNFANNRFYIEMAHHVFVHNMRLESSVVTELASYGSILVHSVMRF